MDFFLDANVIIRFLTNDDRNQSPLAYKLFEKATNGEIVLHLSPMIVAECCWVLSSHRYGYSKKEITRTLTALIHAVGIKTEEKDSVVEALENYSKQNVDLIDAFLSAHAWRSSVNKVITWNRKHFKRLNVEFYSPEEVLSGDR